MSSDPAPDLEAVAKRILHLTRECAAAVDRDDMTAAGAKNDEVRALCRQHGAELAEGYLGALRGIKSSADAMQPGGGDASMSNSPVHVEWRIAVYEPRPGSFNVSLDEAWIAALFDSVEAAVAGARNPDLAEELWRARQDKASPDARISLAEIEASAP